MRGFRGIFIAVVLGFALTISAFLVNRARPSGESGQPSAALARASGKCAECHYRQEYSVVHEYEMSIHAQKHVSCLECHQPQGNEDRSEHHGFTIAKNLTAANCRPCHEPVYQQFLRSRHAAVSWAAVYGQQGLSEEQINFAEQYHPGYAKRPPHPFTSLEGGSAMRSGCEQCHAIGRPNADGSIGSCTACHTRHTSSVTVARQPRTCGQCHMGPDHSQIEIYEESKHGVMFNAQSALLNLSKPPSQLTTHDMWVPTCATCHMSGINGNKVTHDPSERLSYYLADAISKRRPNYIYARTSMQQICAQCHTKPIIERVYQQAEQVVETTNQRVAEAKAIVDSLRASGVLKGVPFTNRIDFVYFDLWHYDGRTSKHGAFMGGADFVQWHGNYPMLAKMVELKAMAADLQRKEGHGR
jgi:hypothetical protein